MELPVGKLNLENIRLLLTAQTAIHIPNACQAAVNKSAALINQIIASGQVRYGINTGFGALASTRIPNAELQALQHHLVCSHAAGVGTRLPDPVVRLIFILKINSLCLGYSGVRWETIMAMVDLLNAQLYPVVPSQGSVGASGDLSPLAHLSAVLLGIGKVRYQGKVISARAALKLINRQPLQLAPKEGLALLNGTQVSTAIALFALLRAENLFHTALISGAMSVEATKSSHVPFDPRIQVIRGHETQMVAAKILRDYLSGSEIPGSHANCQKIQDPYSMRCQPQVMGACLGQLRFAANTLLTEANAVSDNPLIFAEDEDILSGGNFHAQPVAFAADNIALALAEIGSLAERRIAILMDKHFSGLPPFLVPDAGLNSGFMLAHVTAAALVSENKCLATPASVDSIPTSGNQEDHVSMATYAAKRLLNMTKNLTNILAIELLASCQGIDLLRPLTTSKKLEEIHRIIRKNVAFYAKDRYFSPDIKKIYNLIKSEQITNINASKSILAYFEE